MAHRQTLNVSLPEGQKQFVRSQVESGRYRTASEVVRDGLRLLEAEEHRRLVERWIYEDLSEKELARLPEELKRRTRAHFRRLVDAAMEDVAAGRVVDGPEAVERLRDGPRTRGG